MRRGQGIAEETDRSSWREFCHTNYRQRDASSVNC
jgi:hypothetical protein